MTAATTSNITIDPTTGDLSADQGTTLVWNYTLKLSGTPIDLTGWSCHMEVRETYDSVTKLLDLSTTNGKIANGLTTGTFTLTVLPADTKAVHVKGDSLDAVFDVEATDPSGFVWKIAGGNFTLNREVTR